MALGRPYLENNECKISTVFLAVVVAIWITSDHFEKASTIIIHIFPLNGLAKSMWTLSHACLTSVGVYHGWSDTLPGSFLKT